MTREKARDEARKVTLQLQQEVSLAPYNSLGVPARARYFVAVKDTDSLREAIAFSRRHKLPRLILGGGSNIVLSRDFDGIVIHIGFGGIGARITGESVELDVGAGENWDALVRYALANGWYGLENLSAIPGNTGAAPIQNIGAYGVELSRVLVAVQGLDLDSDREMTLDAHECELTYRDSIFKRALRDRFVITRVTLKLSTKADCDTSYKALREALTEVSPASEITPEVVAAAVRRVRAAKLPAPAVIPNVSSFFKNPVVSGAEHERLMTRYPGMPSWPFGERYKLSAGWLVDQVGWRGYSGGALLGGVGVYARQALVLINPEGAPGECVLELAERIRASVCERFGVELEIEPRVY